MAKNAPKGPAKPAETEVEEGVEETETETETEVEESAEETTEASKGGKGKKATKAVVTAAGFAPRTYTLEEHGPEFVALAKSRAAKIGGKVVTA